MINVRSRSLNAQSRGARPALALALAAAAVALGPIAAARARRAPQPVEPRRPALVVIVVVDQMRADYIERYGSQWTAGLRRLVTEGARFSQAAYPYLNTVTCAGHATIGTGALPRSHGLVMNEW